MFASRFGLVRNVMVRITGWVESGITQSSKIPYTIIKYDMYDQPEVQSYAVPLLLKTGTKIKVGFSVAVQFEVPGLDPTQMDPWGFEWDLTVTPDGLTVDNQRAGSHHSASTTLDFSAVVDPPAGQSKSSTNGSVPISIQVTLRPLNTDGPTIGLTYKGAGATLQPTITVESLNTRQVSLAFKDQRPKPQPAPVALPPGFKVFFDEGKSDIYLAPKSGDVRLAPNLQIDAWRKLVEERFPLLWQALQNYRNVLAEPLLDVSGYASTTGTDKVDDKISDDRAKGVIELIAKRATTDKGIRKGSFGKRGPVAERFVDVTVLAVPATEAIRKLRLASQDTRVLVRSGH